MTPRALKAWRLRLDLSQDGLARWLGVSRCTVNRWEGGLAPIPKMVALLEHFGATPEPPEECPTCAGWDKVCQEQCPDC